MTLTKINSVTTRKRGVLSELLSTILVKRFQIMTFMGIFSKNLPDIHVFLINPHKGHYLKSYF